MRRHILQSRVSRTLLVALAAWTAAPLCRAQQTPPPMVISTDKPSGVYQIGDTVHWAIRWKGDTPAPVVHYSLKSGGATEVAHGDLAFADGTATLDSKIPAPNTLLLEVDWQPAGGGLQQAFGGAVAAPDRIRPAAPPPADFDAFWATQVAAIKRVPVNPKLTPEESGQAGVLYAKVTLDNIRGTHVRGQVARPAVGAKFPAILQMQYAGVYGLQKKWVTDYAKDGWLAMDIEAHDIPIDETAQYYKDQDTGPLHYYWNIGDDDRNASYYLRIYLSCYQSIEYLPTAPTGTEKSLSSRARARAGSRH